VSFTELDVGCEVIVVEGGVMVEGGGLGFEEPSLVFSFSIVPPPSSVVSWKTKEILSHIDIKIQFVPQPLLVKRTPKGMDSLRQ